MTTQESPTVQSPAVASKLIRDVFTVPIRVHADSRGRFMETFRKEWFPQVSWDRVQHNRSDSKTGVLRGLHYHFYQVDYWYVPHGTIRAAMVDLRRSSPTYLKTQIVEIGGSTDDKSRNIGVFIPQGVAHGFFALTNCTLMYVVNNYYGDGSDERGVAWNDPDIAIDWGVEDPLVSKRDAMNPRLRDIPLNNLPT